jgi:ferredoxin-NADP reductase
MPSYKIRLLRSEVIAEDTMAFHFEKPEGFTFKAGQFGDWKLIDTAETGNEDSIRAFSFASAPFEPTLMFATRMRDSAFKRVLRAMQPGAEILLDAPAGSFTLHNRATTPAVFLAGGIGVTPVRSIIKQAAYDTLPHRIYVFDANDRPEDAAFLDDLRQAEKENPNCTLVATMARMEKSRREWSGATGYITQELLENTIHDMSRPIYYIVGPRAMVQAMRDILASAGVDDDNIRTEEFSGY